MKNVRFRSFEFKKLQYRFVTFISTTARSENVFAHYGRHARRRVSP